MSIKSFYSVAVCTAFVMIASSASASLSITLDDGSGPVVVMDNGVGDSNLAFGIIESNNATFGFAGFTTLSIVAQSNSGAAAAISNLTTTTLDVNTSAIASLSLLIKDTMFTTPGSPGDLLGVTNGLTGQSTIGSASASQVSRLDGSSTPTASVSVTGVDLDLDSTAANLLRIGTPYTLETDVTFSFGAGTSSLFTSGTTAVIPEPATLAVWGGLIGIGALVARRRQCKVA